MGNIRYRDRRSPTSRFIAPALIAITIMNSAFFENTYASFVRMYYQKTFDAMMATPLTVEEIITGEIIWGATKALIATAIMMAVISFFGLIRYPEGLLLLPLAFLGGLAFGAAGMVCTALVPNIELFNLPVFLFITPMFLFGGTFFPLENLPLWAQRTADAHAAHPSRRPLPGLQLRPHRRRRLRGGGLPGRLRRGRFSARDRQDAPTPDQMIAAPGEDPAACIKKTAERRKHVRPVSSS